MDDSSAPPPTKRTLVLPSARGRNSNKDVIHMERSRREKMSEFYTVLQSMVPNLFPKATRSRIIDETIAYIRGLEGVVVALDARRRSATGREAPRGPQCVLRSRGRPSVDVTMSGNTAFFGLCFPARAGLLTGVLEVFERHHAEVLSTTVASKDDRVTITATVILQGEASADRIKMELLVL